MPIKDIFFPMISYPVSILPVAVEKREAASLHLKRQHLEVLEGAG